MAWGNKIFSDRLGSRSGTKLTGNKGQDYELDKDKQSG
jgi:hypothetical protein